MEKKREKFSQIYEKYIESIYRFIFLKVNSREMAEDLTAETFLKTWQFFQNIDIENPKAFLYKTAQNLIIDYYRKKKPEISIEKVSIASFKENPEENANFNSEIEIIKKALLKLNPEYQNVIVLYYLEELPIAEIAQILDKSESAVRVLIHRALKALRAQLNLV